MKQPFAKGKKTAVLPHHVTKRDNPNTHWHGIWRHSTFHIRHQEFSVCTLMASFKGKTFCHQGHSLSSPCLGTTVISKRLDRYYWRTHEYNSKKTEVTDLLVTMITSSAIEDISLIVR